MSAELDDLVSGAPPPPVTISSSLEEQAPSRVLMNSVSSSKRPRLHSIGASRCTIKFDKEKAKKLGKRFKLTVDGVYRCENEPIGASAYWDNRRVCTECHDLGRSIQKAKQYRQAQIAREGAAKAVSRGTSNVGSSGGGNRGSSGQTQRFDGHYNSREIGFMFVQYFYANFKNKVINIPNGHKMLESCKLMLQQLIPLLKSGRAKFGKEMVYYIRSKVESITKDVKLQTNVWEYCYHSTIRYIKTKRTRETQQMSSGSKDGYQSQQNFMETLNVNIDDIKTETVFTDVLTENEQYDEMILEAKPSTEEMLKHDEEMKNIDVRSKEINVLSKNVLKERMTNALVSAG
jgi:hypothetical protein